jgi:hypothetical protein
MTTSAKAILTIIVIIIIGLVAWWALAMHPSPSASNMPASAAGTDMGGAQMSSTTGDSAAVTSTSSVGSDLDSIDAQMNGLDQDNAAVTSGVEASSSAQ